MSRIYEALQRAERERAIERQRSEAGPAGESMLQPVQPLRPPDRVVSSETARPAEPAEALTSTLIHLGNIAIRPWTPLLAALPSVQERGHTVEQFRSLRSRMQELRSSHGIKSVLVSSGLPEEGKSFVAINLAVSLARHKTSRVLLIDGDMRRASLHKILGCSNDAPGLAEYLSGKASVQEILQRPAAADEQSPLPPGFASLVFIGAGSESAQASDLSGNPRFGELIAALTPSFDWVIVDSSPVNLVADGINLARACDGVLLIARGGVTKFETAQRAVAELKASKILGFVLNAVDESLLTAGYYHYDGYAPHGPK